MSTSTFTPGPPHEFFLTIAKNHLDVLGHVNNAAYLQLFEEARWDMIASKGFGAQDIKERGIGPVILDIHLRFKQEVTEGERVHILTQTTDYRGKIGYLEQQMFRADGAVVCSAEFVIGLFDLKSRKLIAPTPEWLRAVGAEGY